jgi:NADH-quinone oxidoreductase subunit J
MTVVLFFLFGGLTLGAAVGVVLARNPVHSALFLVLTLVSVAVLFLLQDAQLVAAVQIIVYAGAIVVLFLFVIMLLGVDREENIAAEQLKGQRPAAVVIAVVVLVELVVIARVDNWATGAHSTAGQLSGPGDNVTKLGQSIFTRFLFPFEITSVLLVIAVVGAVVLARRPQRVASELSGEEQDAIERGSDRAAAGPGGATS